MRGCSYVSDRHDASAHLIIFARYPTPGRAKTRLIPALGNAGAARLQDALTRHTLDQAAALSTRRRMSVEIRFTGSSAAAMRERYGDKFTYTDQGVGDLGIRLARAASDAAQLGGPIVIIGTDCPTISINVLESAFEALRERDVVFGPALDGGYYLIGFKYFVPELFKGIPWSTPQVFDVSRRVAERAGLSYRILGRLADIDVPEDLEACGEFVTRPPAAYQPARIGITGATGALGQRFLARLLDDSPETQVTALVRPASRSSKSPEFCRLVDENRHRLTLVEGDLETLHPSPADRRALFESDGGLWHFAASTTLMTLTQSGDERVTAVNEGGTARLLEFLAASNRPGPLYYLSTAYVCGQRTGIIYEHDLDGGAGFRNVYERSKHAAEVRVRAAMSTGLSGLVLRPSLVASGAPTPGPADIVCALATGLREAARNGRRLTLRMSATARVNALPAEWLPGILLALAPLADSRRTYHLTAPSDTTIAEVAAVAARSAGIDLHLAPTTELKDLSRAERLVESMLRPFRAYFEANMQFDRRNLELDAPKHAGAVEVDVEQVLRQRLK